MLVEEQMWPSIHYIRYGYNYERHLYKVWACCWNYSGKGQLRIKGFDSRLYCVKQLWQAFTATRNLNEIISTYFWKPFRQTDRVIPKITKKTKGLIYLAYILEIK